MDLVKDYPNQIAIASAVLLVVEQVLPHLPIKANSTVQLILGIARFLLGKKSK